METKSIITALEALAQENRLGAFRALVQTGPQGLTPTRLSEQLDVAPATLSFHLTQLRHAGLITVRREGRSLIYTADYAAVRGVVDFLTENCCAGVARAPSRPKEKTHETPARARRRA